MLALRLDPSPRLDAASPEPVRGSGEALIGLRRAGVCDTDLQLARGYMGFRGVPGHEFVGEVLEAEDGAWVGRRVVGDINAGCGECADCVEGDGHHCARRSVLGIVGRDGCFEGLAGPHAGEALAGDGQALGVGVDDPGHLTLGVLVEAPNQVWTPVSGSDDRDVLHGPHYFFTPRPT